MYYVYTLSFVWNCLLYNGSLLRDFIIRFDIIRRKQKSVKCKIDEEFERARKLSWSQIGAQIGLVVVNISSKKIKFLVPSRCRTYLSVVPILPPSCHYGLY